MDVYEEEFRIVAHIISEKRLHCGCIDTVTARLVLRDGEGFNRVVLALGEAETKEKAVENALRAFESGLRT